jgi:hypothetical protein
MNENDSFFMFMLICKYFLCSHENVQFIDIALYYRVEKVMGYKTKKPLPGISQKRLYGQNENRLIFSFPQPQRAFEG